MQVYFRREGLGGNYLCGQSPTEEQVNKMGDDHHHNHHHHHHHHDQDIVQEPNDTDLTKVDMDWFEEQVKLIIL